jgi:hypothetical protein
MFLYYYVKVDIKNFSNMLFSNIVKSFQKFNYYSIKMIDYNILKMLLDTLDSLKFFHKFS